jgi:transposase
MKIIRVAIKERCPHCGYKNEVDLTSLTDGKMNCGSCGGHWDANASNNEEPKAFAEPPPRAGYENPRGKANYTPYNP